MIPPDGGTGPRPGQPPGPGPHRYLYRSQSGGIYRNFDSPGRRSEPVLFLAGAGLLLPDGSMVLEAGDEVDVIGPDAALDRLGTGAGKNT